MKSSDREPNQNCNLNGARSEEEMGWTCGKNEEQLIGEDYNVMDSKGVYSPHG